MALFIQRGITALICTAAGFMIAANATAKPYDGIWGGDRVNMMIDSKIISITLDCAAGSFLGPLKPDKAGRFSAKGVFEIYRGGPQRADDFARIPATAQFRGQIKKNVMQLIVTPAGAKESFTYTLKRGQTQRLVRCL